MLPLFAGRWLSGVRALRIDVAHQSFHKRTHLVFAGQGGWKSFGNRLIALTRDIRWAISSPDLGPAALWQTRCGLLAVMPMAGVKTRASLSPEIRPPAPPDLGAVDCA